MRRWTVRALAAMAVLAVAAQPSEAADAGAVARRGAAAREERHLAPNDAPKKGKKEAKKEQPKPQQKQKGGSKEKKQAHSVAAADAKKKAAAAKAAQAKADKEMAALDAELKKHKEEEKKHKTKKADLEAQAKKADATDKKIVELRKKEAKEAAEEKDSVDLGGQPSGGGKRGPLGRTGGRKEVKQWPPPGTKVWHNGKKMHVPYIDEREGLMEPKVTSDSRDKTLVEGENAVAKDGEDLPHSPQIVDRLGLPKELDAVETQAKGKDEVAREKAAEQNPHDLMFDTQLQWGRNADDSMSLQNRAIDAHKEEVRRRAAAEAARRGAAAPDPQDLINAEFERQLAESDRDAQELSKQIMLTKMKLEGLDSEERAADAGLVSNFYSHVDEDEEVTGDLGSIDEPTDLSGRALRFNIKNRLAHAQAIQKKVEAPAPDDKIPAALAALMKLRALINT